jgi:predicted enzyme related to lactoylglutathione lyase
MAVVCSLFIFSRPLPAKPGEGPELAVGPQYDSTHVYVAAADFDTFVKSLLATLGGKASPRISSTVTPTTSRAQFQIVQTPMGILSIFTYETPIPYPFGLERTGWLVSDMDRALKVARDNGAAVIVNKWRDPIGDDAIIEWPGGVKMQLYIHFTPPKYPPLDAAPETRFYVSRDRAEQFVHGMLGFSQGKIVSDDPRADGGELGKPGDTFRRIRLDSHFGKLQVNVTDGHLPYPFGYEITGYEVRDLDATLAKARANGVAVLSTRFDGVDRSSVIVQFPGGYFAELHQLRSPRPANDPDR